MNVMRQRLTAALDSNQYVLGMHRMFWLVGPMIRDNAHCVFLGSRGCTLSESERPAMCLALTPSEQFPRGCHYPIELTLNGKRDALVHYGMKWLPYKPLLKELAAG